ncbi:hypothetical protein CALCODRAFT_487194 [Calocera cornea HHB12733]|uniref:CENP-V/GFA domain-containing protein n=1 Tax=Calocera cornea HHB12733 TaxID=1353952 RepID=A0A165D9J2_9BASI|nr:hypothetical protein CALCODRAFT_487194 [Calocera cornea HHB12733]
MTTRLTLRCHSGQNTWSLPYPTASLPLNAWYCHCSICRHVSGAPFVAHLGQLPISLCESTASPPATSRAYNTSSKGRRYFCSKCGTYLATSTPVGVKPEQWFACVGALELGSLKAQEVYKFSEHYDLASTVDGGFARWLDDGLPKWVAWGPEEFHFPTEPLTPARPTSGAKEALNGACHCGGVTLELLQP